MRKTSVRAVLLALLVAAVVVPTAVAATIVSEEEYVLAEGETIEGDYYIFAQSVLIEGTVKGDLIAAGTEVTIGPTGVVEQDLMAAGRDVIVSGRVGDDVRAAGFLVRVDEDGKVDDDFLAAGFSVEADDGSDIAGDVIAAGYQGVLNGAVGGSALFGGNALQVEGTIDGDLTADVGGDVSGSPFMLFPGMPRVEMIDPGITFGDSASVGGHLKLTSPMELGVPPDVAETVEVLKPAATPEEPEEAEEEQERPWIVNWLIEVVKDYIALIVFGLVILWLLPKAMTGAAYILDSSPLTSAGWGCLVLIIALVGLLALFIATVLAFIIIGVTKIGPLAGPVFSASFVVGTLLTFGLYLLTWVAKVSAGEWIGRFLVRGAKPGSALARFGPLLVGLAVYVILANLPTIGFLFEWAGVILGLGALVLATRPHWPSPAVAAVPEAAME